MISFSERHGIVPARAIQIDSVDDRLRNRLWNYFFNEEFVEKYEPIGIDWASSNYGMVEDMLDLLGCRYEDPDSTSGRVHNQQALQRLLRLATGITFTISLRNTSLSFLLKKALE